MERRSYDKRTHRQKKKEDIPQEFTMITALETILDKVEDSGVEDDYRSLCPEAFDYLIGRLGLTEFQIVILAVMADTNEIMSFPKFAEFLDVRSLRILSHFSEFEDLVLKGWIVPKSTRDYKNDDYARGYRLAKNALASFMNNSVFEPEDLSGLSMQTFMDMLAENIIFKDLEYDAERESAIAWADRLLLCNHELPLVDAILQIDHDYEQFMMLLFLADFAKHGKSSATGISLDTVSDIFCSDYKYGFIKRRLSNDTSEMQLLGYVEHKCVNGIADPEEFVLSDSFIKNHLDGYVPKRAYHRWAPRDTDQNLVAHTSIQARELYFNPKEKMELERVSSLLESERLSDVQSRLEGVGMRKGIACIFHGAPGTGKTESVLQLARRSGRDLIRVDISTLRDKWVGESEKNIRQIFVRYRDLCHNMKRAPILLFNEADAIFNRRIEKPADSVDQMNNAMQNIILEEMENLEGILIATTNLEGNLDDAFERRFLFKIRFDKPGEDVRRAIWKSMLSDRISESETRQLAGRFELSGGQIENVVRKALIEFALTGIPVDLEKLSGFCEQERYRREHSRIGF